MMQMGQLTSDDDCKQCIALELPIEIVDANSHEVLYKGFLTGYDSEYFFVEGKRFERDSRKNVAVRALDED